MFFVYIWFVFCASTDVFSTNTDLQIICSILKIICSIVPILKIINVISPPPCRSPLTVFGKGEIHSWTLGVRVRRICHIFGPFAVSTVRRWLRDPLWQEGLGKILVVEETEKIDNQLDYVLISRRHNSCVTQCRPRWGPSKHRDLHGHRNDHTLVECIVYLDMENQSKASQACMYKRLTSTTTPSRTRR